VQNQFLEGQSHGEFISQPCSNTHTCSFQISLKNLAGSPGTEFCTPTVGRSTLAPEKYLTFIKAFFRFHTHVPDEDLRIET